MFSLKGQIALVTGAYGHLGKSIAYALAEAGAQVIIQGRDKDKIASLAAELKSQSYDVKEACFDITDKDATGEYFEQANLHKLNVLVNNAYSGVGGTIKTSTEQQYHDAYDIGLVSVQRLFKLTLPLLEQGSVEDNNASCINIASMYGLVSPDFAIYDSEQGSNPPFYGAVKAALLQWTRYCAVQFAKQGIRINAIAPGPFPNKIVQQDKAFISRLQDKSPMGRIGKPDEIKGAIVYLASKASSYVTGENISVDGGWTAW